MYSYIYIYIQQGDCAVLTFEMPHTQVNQKILQTGAAIDDDVYACVNIHAHKCMYTRIHTFKH